MTILLGLFAFFIPATILVAVIYFLVRAVRGASAGDGLNVKELAIDGGIFITLITSIVALVSIIFSAIDKKFVDVLKQTYYGYQDTVNDDVRVAVSIILVAYPMYLLLAYYRANYLKANPARRNISAMKYVNYIILAVASLFILGSLATTIYEYLGGELGVAFAYKLLTVVIIAAILIVYNYFTLKRNYDTKSNIPNILAVISLIAVISAVVYSISILGSPAEVRKTKFDEKRLTDLSNIQNEILNYWTRNKILPANINSIQGDGFNNGFIIPTDPKTKTSYEYKIVEMGKSVKKTGQDCATYYPNKFNALNNNNVYDVTKLSCEIPGKSTFEICANFETVRAYDENGIEQTGWDATNALGVPSLDAKAVRYSEVSYYDSYTKNSNWNHNIGNTCFKRTIDPLKYPQY